MSAAAACDASPPPAHSILFTISNARFAKSGACPHVAAIGDADGDRVADLVVANQVEPRGSDTCVAVVHSGKDGARLHECIVPGLVRSRWPVDLYPVGDVDGDGRREVAAVVLNDYGSPSGASVCVLSSADGRMVLEIENALGEERFGENVMAGGDLDRDGADDVLVHVGGPDISERPDLATLTTPGLLRAYSGRTGEALWTWQGVRKGEEFGREAAAAADCNGDGFPDVLVGVGGCKDGGRALLISGRDGSILREFPADRGERHFGSNVSLVRDLDGDGASDLLIEAVDQARIHSARTGALLRRIPPARDSMAFGLHALQRAGDWNGDGLEEFVTSDLRTGIGGPDPFEHNATVACLVDGATGTELEAVEFNVGGFPPRLALLGDIDGDGSTDLALPTLEQIYVVSGQRFFGR